MSTVCVCVCARDFRAHVGLMYCEPCELHWGGVPGAASPQDQVATSANPTSALARRSFLHSLIARRVICAIRDIASYISTGAGHCKFRLSSLYQSPHAAQALLATSSTASTAWGRRLCFWRSRSLLLRAAFQCCVVCAKRVVVQHNVAPTRCRAAWSTVAASLRNLELHHGLEQSYDAPS